MELVQEFSSSQGKEVKWHGNHDENCKRLLLKAGQLSMFYESGNLRYISIGNIEIVRMIYSALRDKEWLTIKPVISEEEFEVGPDSFRICYKALYRSGEIDFPARYTLIGNSDNSLIFSFEGEAMSSFEKNRIGFCVLHPAEGYGGKRCEIVQSNGKSENLVFPGFISPHQPFLDIKSMKWQISDFSCSIDFYGDIFETEDQRNWTDASYKTYCTPLSRPYPVTVQMGEMIAQKIVLNVEGGYEEAEGDTGQTTITIDREKIFPVPMIGIGRSTRPEPLTEGEIQILKRLRFDHYRVDLYLFRPDWRFMTERSVNESKILEYPLELSLFFDDNALNQSAEFIDWISTMQHKIALINIFHQTHQSTPDLLTDSVVPILKKALPGVSFGCGTNANFARLNRNRPQSVHNDYICYSIQPQEHASDNSTLVENLAAQHYTVESARRFSNGRKIWISPVTIQRRFNANIGNFEKLNAGNNFPLQVDSRLMSLFGASWTAGSLKYLLESGIKGVTYYETVGERGIFQGEYPSRWPDKFPSYNGMIYPVYFVFKYILNCKNSDVVGSKSTHPLNVESLVISDGDHLKMILVNFTSAMQKVIINGWSGGFSIRQLNDETFEKAVSDINWWDKTEIIAATPSEPLFLKPFSVSFAQHPDAGSSDMR